MGEFSFFHWLIVGAIVYGVFRLFTGSKGEPMHCMTCGTDAPSEVRTRGSILIEIVLWLCFIIPGVIYSLWRLTTKRHVCSACGAENIVPPQSPAAVSHRKSIAA